LSDLEAQRAVSEDSLRATAQRIGSLPRDSDTGKGLLARLTAERDRFAARHRVYARLLSACNQWLTELRLPSGAVLELAPAVEVKLAPGQTASAALAEVRAEIVSLQRELASVRSAPLRKASQRESVATYLARLVQRVQPRIGFDTKGNAKVQWPIEDMVVKDDLLAVLAWALGPDALLTAFTREIEREPERADAVTPVEREKRISELLVQLLESERREAALLDGLDNILPRPDMDPRAFLGVVVAQAQASAA
jgi:hypothetical protein